MCCRCLCSVSLPRGCVGWSWVWERGILCSLSNYFILQLTQIMTLIRLHCCTGYSARSFFACNLVWFSRDPYYWYQPLSVYWYQYYTFCINYLWNPINEYFCKQRRPRWNANFIRVYTVCKGKLSSYKRIQYIFENYNLTLYHGLTRIYFIKPEGRIQ